MGHHGGPVRDGTIQRRDRREEQLGAMTQDRNEGVNVPGQKLDGRGN